MDPKKFLSTKHGHDLVDGQKTPQLVITEDFVLDGEHQGRIHVEAGTFTLEGEHQGSLRVYSGAAAIIRGSRQGSLMVERGASVTVTGDSQGSSTVDEGGALIIESSGEVAGSITNFGRVVVRGEHVGSRRGSGELVVEGGVLKDPISFTND